MQTFLSISTPQILMLVGPKHNPKGYKHLLTTYAVIDDLLIPQPQFFFEDFEAIDILESMFGSEVHRAVKSDYAVKLASEAEILLYQMLTITKPEKEQTMVVPKKIGKFPFATIDFFNRTRIHNLKHGLDCASNGCWTNLTAQWKNMKDQYTAWEQPPAHYGPHSIVNMMHLTYPDGVARLLLHHCPKKFDYDIKIIVSTLTDGSRRPVPRASVEYKGKVYFTVKPAFEDPMYNGAGKKFEIDIKEPKQDILIKTLNDYMRSSSGIFT